MKTTCRSLGVLTTGRVDGGISPCRCSRVLAKALWEPLTREAGYQGGRSCCRCAPRPSRQPGAAITSSSAGSADPDVETTLPEQLRSVLRCLTNPIVVCTATHDGTPRAMTMSSFTSLTLSPTPLVSFNIATPSRTLDAIAASREFNIHVLAGDASGAAVADHFARGNADGVFATMEGATYTAGGRGGRDAAPLIAGEGILRVLRCTLLREGAMEGLVRVRDHVVVVGEVLGMTAGAGANKFGLAYADRRYRRVGGVIEPGRW
ncbi:hypothetical protein UVI_02008460 [Ustilaginoidea virens]|uniref:Flavin reductase like domain-containing protein n=1 Tax=Ustilaginoidea virens TaxID=1159556 RepID=A0A1B5L6Q3_USTVR|nr:hypothetical protein UVI_02008460 [Ustilaginoidea virens]